MPSSPQSHHPRGRVVALAALAAVGLLAASCGGSSSSSGSGGVSNATTIALPDCPIHALDDVTQPVDVVVWHSYVAKTKDTLEQLVAQYNASQSKVRVHVESQGASYDELLRKYQSGIASKQLPAIAIMEDNTVKSMADSGTVLPAQSCINAENLNTSDYEKTAVDFYSVGGALYPASANLSTNILYYNVNHFRKAGLDPANPPKTLDEIRQAAEKIKAAGVVAKPVVLKLDPWFWEVWNTGQGAPMVDNDNGRGPGQTTAAAFDDPKTLQTVQWLKGMIDDGLLQPIPFTDGQVNDYLALAQQTGSMTIETSVAATSIKAFLGGNLDVGNLSPGADTSHVDLNALDIAAAPVPGVTDPGRAQVSGGAWYMTNTGSPQVQAASWDFMKWWNALDPQVSWLLDGSYLPFNAKAVDDPRVQQAWTTDLAGRWLAISWKQLEAVDPAFPGPMIGPSDKFREAFKGALESVAFKGSDPQQAVTTASDQTTAAIEQYNRDTF
jgi:sn-glycerol 3-phosphate transport system substrate-binding protein